MKKMENISLPEAFVEKMSRLLGDGAGNFFESYERERSFGLRVNPLKAGERLPGLLSGLERIPWSREGFYYPEELRPGKHPLHEAGAYYIQEPSAQACAEALDPRPGERILDLCAAPGGKSTHLAGKMEQKGLLVCNEIHPARAKILSQNIERMGIGNAVVTNMEPAGLVSGFREFFDGIAVDAPCSGEGMFRKDENARLEWSPAQVAVCAARQDQILDCAAAMVRPGGRILYSTCTFSQEENEKSIGDFLERHPEFELMPIAKKNGFAEGLAPYTDCARLYPHRLKGEGHFLALLRKKEAAEGKAIPAESGGWTKEMDAFGDFAKEVLQEKPKGIYKIYGEGLYLLPEGTPKLEKLRVLRTGWMLGTLKKGRFEPSQAFAMGLRKEEVKHTADFSLEDERVIRYLKGETVEAEGKDGWTLVCVDGFPLGWAKRQKGRLKNKYAVSWKWE